MFFVRRKKRISFDDEIKIIDFIIKFNAAAKIRKKSSMEVGQLTVSNYIKGYQIIIYLNSTELKLIINRI